MASPKEQVKPFAPANSHYLRSDEEEVASLHIKLRQRKYVHCCGCVSAVFLIIAVTAIVLGFTVFHVKDPKIKMNEVTVQRLELANGTLRSDTNITLLADVSVKNPNVASFKYSNATTLVYYSGTEVGEGRTPAGVAKARRTSRMNVTVDIVPRKILGVPGLMREVASGELTMTTYTRIQGKVKVVMVKKNVVVELNCTVRYNFSSGEIQREDCKRRVRL
ncbi:late embryogenesis abundant protein At1g64065 [Pyrus x bretschneideri]|uniref:late embryogenesis abundant protein At1g64065 n=1 Tax=Pyrus x bretschneideri TaxID=225117 RepID=UPI00051198B1|nr:late embryogenesis abundant protein At1g64065 [Pyrus x bretschneideri]